MNDYKQLRIYLIRKFILVIVMLSVVEYVVMKLLNRTIIASMMQAFFEGSDVDEIGMSGIVLIVIAVSLSLLMELVRLFIPSVFSAQISGIDDFLRSITNSNNDENEIVNVSNHLSVSSEIILVMMMLAIFSFSITFSIISHSVVVVVGLPFWSSTTFTSSLFLANLSIVLTKFLPLIPYNHAVLKI